MQKLNFGQKGIWHKPASEEKKAKNIKAVVLEQTPEGLLYIFTYDRSEKTLTGRTATIFPSDFELPKESGIEMRAICNVCGSGMHVFNGECVKCQSTDIGYQD